jgi:transglutaminase-like putative cysteine protease
MITRLLNWLIARLGLPNIFAFALLILALGSLVWTISNLIHWLDPNFLLTVIGGGLLLGWLMAVYKPIPGWLATLLAAILGFELIIVWVGNLQSDLLAIGLNGLNLLGEMWPKLAWVWPDTSLFIASVSKLWLDFNILMARMRDWLLALAQSQAAFDPVAATLVWGLVLWAVAVWAGWVIRRWRHPLAALAPAGSLLAIILAYNPKHADNLVPLLTATLLLLGLINHYARQQHWNSTNVDYPSSTLGEMASFFISITIGILILAWAIPSLSIKEVTRFARRLLDNQTAQAQPVADSLGLELNLDEPGYLTEFRTPGLPRNHLIGSGPELSKQVAFIVTTGDAVIGSTPVSFFNRPAPRYYWRSLTYDVYNGRGWRTSTTQKFVYEASQPASPAEAPGRRVLRHQVELESNQGDLLFAGGDLVAADHSYTVDWRGPGDPFAATIEADAYYVDALVPVLREEDIRAAGSNYPDWISKRYLHIPQETPGRVLNLARDLTATAPTPYDRAKAIETYLRAFPYNLDLPKPPAHQDIVDYFLFDLQQGYCDYYASSMVILARAAGIPARLAVGYASGAYDAENARYIVTEADAHSWPELYFPEYGWIPFEPTAAQPVSNYANEPEQAEPPQALPPLPPAETALEMTFSLKGRFIFPGVVVTLLTLGGMAWLITDSWRLRRLTPAAAVVALYRRLQRQGQRLALPYWAGETPYEFAAALTRRVELLAQNWRWGKSLLPIPQEIEYLTNLYVQTSYSTHPPNNADQRRAIQSWRRLRRRLWLAWLLARAARFSRRQ